jgi:hypothetical protein
MLKFSEILIELVAEVLRWLRLTFRSSQSIQVENLFLRWQLALHIERGVKPRSPGCLELCGEVCVVNVSCVSLH